MMKNAGWEFMKVKFGDTRSLGGREVEILVQGDALAYERPCLASDS